MSKEVLTVKVNTTKQKVIDEATWLFYQKGFHGTSVRDISERANVNVSLISYYFKSKQGLLEYAVINYYEQYFETIQKIMEETQHSDHIDLFKKVILSMLEYKTKYFHLTFFIQRELSLDTTFVREMTVTYLAKENSILYELFSNILNNKFTFKHHYLLLQLKGMILTPFMLRNEMNQQLMDDKSREKFIESYVDIIFQWVDFLQNIKL